MILWKTGEGGVHLPRPPKCRRICSYPYALRFCPVGVPAQSIVTLGYDEYETLRLIDLENCTQAECAKKMNVSRTTVTRMYASARSKLANALVNGRRLEISGGDVVVCTAPRPECAGVEHCCHKKKS